jgi:hypothetical protein
MNELVKRRFEHRLKWGDESLHEDGTVVIIDSEGLFVQIEISSSLYKHFLDMYDNTEYGFRLSNKQMERMPHEVVCRALSDEKTDSRLSSLLELGLPSDRLTPDFIWKTEDGFHVCEVKTTRRHELIEQRSLEGALIYQREVENRALKLDVPVDLTSISVSCESACVMSTDHDEVDYDKVKLMIELYALCSIVRTKAYEVGWVGMQQDEDSEDIKVIKESMKSMVIPEEGKGVQIGKDDIREWGSLSPRDCLDYSMSVMNERASKINEELIDGYESGEIAAAKGNIERLETRVNRYKREHEEHYLTKRTDLKAPCQIPFAIVEHRSVDNAEYHLEDLMDLQTQILPEDTMTRLWNKAVMFAAENKERFLPGIDKSKKFRVKVALDPDDWMNLAVSGIQAKTWSKHDRVAPEMEVGRRGFRLGCPTGDIDSFITQNHFERIEGPSGNDEDVFDLMKKAMELAGTDTKYPDYSLDFLSFTRSFYETKLARGLETISRIAEELNLSRQQFCKRDEFILKEMPTQKMFLLIKPTRPDRAIFFSVVVLKEHIKAKMDLPFKAWKEYETFYMTEFVSLNKHSITHLLYLREKALSLTAMWMQLFNVFLTEQRLDCLDPEITAHINASILFWIEGKEATSKECQQIRYAYMDLTRGNIMHSDPMKILNKWDTYSRSRLTVWMRNQVIRCFQRMDPRMIVLSSVPENQKDWEQSNDSVRGMLSWVTCTEVRSFEILLNLSYFGVLHNKQNSVEVHGMLKIFSKVISEELKMRECSSKVKHSDVDLENPKPHSFSERFVCGMGDTLMDELRSKYGGTTESVHARMRERIYTRFLRRDLNALSTLKKSATGELWRSTHDPKSKENERITCLEACHKFAGEYNVSRPFKVIGKISDEVEKEYGGIVVNLFKKLQIGGVREIFVLEFRCRIITHFLETICRTICEDIDGEMLTKGTDKLKRTDKYFISVRTNMNSTKSSDSVMNSDDATTWAQRFIMPVFGCFLSRILPSEMMEPCMKILNLVSSKKLELPSMLLKLFSDNPEVRSTDPNLQELKDQFLGVSDNSDLLDKGCRMLKNQSNMMQGILHYTSSLVHCGFMLLYEKYCHRLIESRKGLSIPLDAKYLTLYKVSSDDSSFIQTIVYPRRADKKHHKHYLCVLSKLKGDLYPLFTAKQSTEKSTSESLSGVEEFNSVWYYCNTLLSPVIKFISSSVKSHLNTNLSDRFHTYSNLRKDVFENGGSTNLCNVVSVAQCFSHYKTLGLNTNYHWKKYKEKLLDSPHPVAGFFLFENPLLCGMFGHNLSMYTACASKRFRLIHLGLFKNPQVEFDRTGQPRFRTHISFGQSLKYKSMQSKMGIEPRAVVSEVESKPVLLVRPTMKPEETALMLKYKATNPVIAESMQFQNDAKMHAASVYILQEKVMFVTSNAIEGQHMTSLLSLFDHIQNIEDGDYKWLFQFSHLYDNIVAGLDSLRDSSIAPPERRRSVSAKVNLRMISAKAPVSLMNVLRRKWFGIENIRGSRFSHKASFEWYRESRGLSWMGDTLEETLASDECPFRDSISLINYVHSTDQSWKSIRSYCPMDPCSSDLQMIWSMIKYCQWRGRRCVNVLSRETVTTRENDYRRLSEKLWRVTTAPPGLDRIQVMREIFRTSSVDFSLDFSKPDFELTRAHKAVSVIANYMRTERKKRRAQVRLLEAIESVGQGTVGKYEIRQRRNSDGEYVGRGLFRGRFDGQKVEIHLRDNYVRKLVFSSIESTSFALPALKTFLRDLGVKKSPEMSGSLFLNYRTGRVTPRQKTGWEAELQITEIPWELDYDSGSVSVQFTSYGQIRLIQTDDRDAKLWYTILSCRVTHRDLGDGQPIDIKWNLDDDLCKTWLENKVQEPSIILDRCSKDVAYDKWVAEMIRHRCRGRGIKTTMIVPLYDKEGEEPDVIEYEEPIPMFSFSDLDDLLTGEEEPETSGLEILETVEGLFEMSMHSERVLLPLDNSATNSRYFDKLIDLARAESPFMFREYIDSRCSRFYRIYGLMKEQRAEFRKALLEK